MSTAAGPAIEARGLVRRFGAVEALAGVDLTLAAGEAVALVGPNGAGKTTLLQLLTLGLRPDAGTLRIAGLDPRRDDLEIRRRTGVLSHAALLYEDLTPRENLVLFGRLYGTDDPAVRADALLERLGLIHRADDPVRTLSRGMRQRVSLARALVHQPELLLLDEPFTGLDVRAAASLAATLSEMRGRAAVVLVSHDARRALALTERWVLLDQGKVVDHGSAAETRPEELERRLHDVSGNTTAARLA